MNYRRYWVIFVFVLMVAMRVLAAPQHGVAMYGDVAYPEGFHAFSYVNPDAPKGGRLRQASYAAFDSFNPFIINGISAPGIHLTHDTLMKASHDEAFSLYALVAQSIEVAPDRSWVAFVVNPMARFSDNSSITADDVVFSFHILKEKGLPTYRYSFNDVDRVVKTSSHRVVFYFKEGVENRELPLILGDLPVLSKAYWDGRDFAVTTQEIPVTSGPYLIDNMEMGRWIEYKRNPDYWATDLNVNRGYYNFDKVRFDVYRDTTVAVEAFRAGLFDLRMENEAKKWAAFLLDDLVRSKKIVMKSFSHQLPSGMQGFVFNTRRPVFAQAKVREALAYAFDFTWVNTNLFFGLYRRTESYFDNSPLRAPPLPSAAELKLLNPYKKDLPGQVFTDVYRPPQNTGNLRWNLEKALKLLAEAGWTVQDGILCDANKQPFEFEILLDSVSAPVWERVTQPFVGQLKRLGIHAKIKTVDVIQYKNRLDQFDYDMIVFVWGQSLSPGNEQLYFWGSDAANTPGSWNFSGIENPVVDAIIGHVVGAQTAQELQTAVHALDRVLLWSHLVVPHWHLPVTRYVFWDKFGYPDAAPMKGSNLMTWWQKE